MPLIVAAAATCHAYPRFQPVSIAFVDGRHGVLGEDDWTCQKTHSCQGRILITDDSGAHWRVTYVGARGIHLYPIRETRVVYAMTGTVMLKSIDAGAHWWRVLWPPSVLSFVTPTLGWKIGPTTTIAHPPPLEQTRDGGQSWTDRVNPCRGDYGLTAAISFATDNYGWVVCSTQATAGYQGKEVLRTADGGTHWTLAGRTHPLAPPEPKLQLGNLPGYGYPIGATFLADGRGWLLQDRGYMLVTTDAGPHLAQFTDYEARHDRRPVRRSPHGQARLRPPARLHRAPRPHHRRGQDLDDARPLELADTVLAA